MGTLVSMWLRKSTLLVFFFLITPTLLFPQNQDLRSQFDLSENDTTKINAAKQLFGKYVYSKADSAIFYAEQIVEISSKIDWQENVVLGNKYLGIAFSIKGEFAKAADYMTRVLQIHRSSNDSLNIAFSLNNLGTNYLYAGEYLLAVEALIEAISYKESLVKAGASIAEVDMSSTLQNIGIAYESQSDTAQAKSYYLRAIDAGDQQNAPLVAARARSSLGSILLSENRHEEALLYFRQTESVFVEANDVFALSKTYNNMALTFSNMNNNAEVVNYAKKAISSSQQIGNRRSEGLANMYLGLGYFKQRRFNEAIRVSLQALRIGEELESLDIQHSTLKNLYESYDGLGNRQQAYSYLLKHQEIGQEMYDLDRTEQIEQLTAKYETDKKVMEIANLNQKAELQEAELDKAAWQRNLLIVLLLAAALIITLVVYFFKQISQKNSELKALNTTKDRFFSIVSHDLRGHISAFQGTGRLVRHFFDQKDEQKLEALTSEIDKNANNLSQLLDNLLKWSVGQLKGYESKPVIIEVKSVSQEILDIFAPAAKAKGIALINDLNDDDRIIADRGAFAVTLRNLIANAVKFTAEGEVKVSSRRQGADLVISVSDTGVGIPEEIRVNLFEINEEKIRRGTKNEKGTGLGLNLAYEFTKINEGRLELEDKERNGTTFLIYLKNA